MNDDAHNDAVNRSVSLNNESTPYSDVFASAHPIPTSGATTDLGGGGYLLKLDNHCEDFEE